MSNQPHRGKQPPTVRIHNGGGVRHHASGRWTKCIGKALNRSKTKLIPKDFYFANMTEDAANIEAKKLQDRWAFLVRNWSKLYQPTLAVLGSDFADVPHWQPSLGEQPTEQEIDEYQNRPSLSSEVAEAYPDITLGGIESLYLHSQQLDVLQGDKQNVTKGAIAKNLRCGLTFFDKAMRVADFSGAVIDEAKSAMLKKLSRRTVKNYITEVKVMLEWFYASDYYGGQDKPSHWDKRFAVKSATRTDIKIHTAKQLKKLIDAANDRQRLYALLALNCGMTQSDIGRLQLSEIKLSKGYIFWDREKEPQNPFRVRHDLWKETIALVKKYMQKSDARKIVFHDYRNGKRTEIDCSNLAFVDTQGLPLYRVRENGDTYDKISESWKDLKIDGYKFRDLRKSSNQILKNILNSKIDGDDGGQLIAIQEISDTFLAHKTDQLVRVYETMGEKGFARMNKYLAEVGNELRAGEVLR